MEKARIIACKQVNIMKHVRSHDRKLIICPQKFKDQDEVYD